MSQAIATRLPQPPAASTPPRQADRQTRTRPVAIVFGLIGFVLAVATPLLPIRHDVATIDWPQPGKTSVTAPLVSYTPLSFTANIACSVLNPAPGGNGILLSTVPVHTADSSTTTGSMNEAPEPAKTGLVVAVQHGTLSILQREIPLFSAPVVHLRCTTIHINSTASATSVVLAGYSGTNPPVVHQDVRPQMVGLFTDLPAVQLRNIRAHVLVDTRFTAWPTMVKLIAMIGAVVATLVALVALHRLDTMDGRRSRRFLPAARRLRFGAADVVVLGTLLVWHFIGGNTSDDGYILTMARVRDHAGYLANYYRWYGVPEAPFGWSYELLALLTKVTDASAWVRLMALVPAVGCWLVISREMLPRLGTAVRHSRIALWTAGLVFLAFWLPYNNGLRPEPLIALGALMTWWAMERAIATGRLLPAAVAVLVAAFSLGAGPTGLMCVAALLAGSRPIVQIIVARAKGAGVRGYAALLAPGFAAGVLVGVVVFVNQSAATVLESTTVRKTIGPNVAWFDEKVRWEALLSMAPDGSLERRFGVLAMLLMALVCVIQVLRKGGQIPGTARGPVNRLLGIIFASLVFLMFTPTKFTHHFGAFAGLAGSLAALGAVAVSTDGIRSRRNRALFAAAVLFVSALSFTGPNGWWYVSSYAIPWFDKPPSLHGKGVSTGLLGSAVIALLIAAWHHYREPYVGRQTVAHAHDRRAARAISAPLTIAAGLVVLLEVLSFLKGACTERHTYSVAEQNLSSLGGHICGLSDKVLVEQNPNEAMLAPVTGQPAEFTAQSTGFSPDGVAQDLIADAETRPVGGANTVNSTTGGKTSLTTEAGTGNGRHLPYGLARTTPVMGNYIDGPKMPATFTSRWYRLRRGADMPLLVFTAAGRIHSIDNGVDKYGQNVTVEYGTVAANGVVTKHGSVLPLDAGPAPSWRNLRVPLSSIPMEATAVRITVMANDITPDQWVAVTPPRVPVLRPLQSVVGSAPALLDWHVSLAFPCQQPFGHRNGVAQIPQYRILPDRVGADVSNHWEDSIGGGPLGWTELLFDAQTVPAYLDNDWGRDWGSLQRLHPYDPQAVPATINVNTMTRSGMASDPHILLK